MRKLFLYLLALMMLTLTMGNLEVEAKSNPALSTNNVGVLKSLSLDGQSYTKVNDNTIVISNIYVDNSTISLQGRFIQNINSNKKNPVTTPFHLQGELFRSIDKDNVYVGELSDKLGNFEVVHFSIDKDLNVNNPSRYFELNKQFVEGFSGENSLNKASKYASLVNLYLINENRDFIFLEELTELNLDLPHIKNLEQVAPIEELWFSKIIKPVGMIVIDHEDDLDTIENELRRIPSQVVRRNIIKEVKESKRNNPSLDDISLLNAASYTTIGKNKSYTAWHTLGVGENAAHHYEHMTVRYEVYGPTAVNPGVGAPDNSTLVSTVKAEMKITSQVTTTYNYNYTDSFTRNYTTFLIGRNSNLVFDRNRDIEVRILTEKPKTSTSSKYYDFFNQAQASYSLQNSGNVNWAALILNGINRVPVLGEFTSLLSSADVTGSTSVSTDFFSTTQELSSIASKPPISTYMENVNHRFTLHTTLGSKFQSGVTETRHLTAQFRYFVGNSWGESFHGHYQGEKYYTESVRFSYIVNAIKY